MGGKQNSSTFKVFQGAYEPCPSDAEAIFCPKHKDAKTFFKPSKPCHVGIRWISLTEYSNTGTHMPGFQTFFSFFSLFCIVQISQQQHNV